MNECRVPGIGGIGELRLAPGESHYIGDCGVTGTRRGMSYTIEIWVMNANGSGRTLTFTPTAADIKDVGNAAATQCSRRTDIQNGVQGFAIGGRNSIGNNGISYLLYSWS